MLLFSMVELLELFAILDRCEKSLWGKSMGEEVWLCYERCIIVLGPVVEMDSTACRSFCLMRGRLLGMNRYVLYLVVLVRVISVCTELSRLSVFRGCVMLTLWCV